MDSNAEKPIVDFNAIKVHFEIIGARPSENLNLRIGDIVKDGNDVIVNI